MSRGSPWFLGATPEVDFKAQQNGQVKEQLKEIQYNSIEPFYWILLTGLTLN